MANKEWAQVNKQSAYNFLFYSGELWQHLLIYNRLILTKSSSACNKEI